MSQSIDFLKFLPKESVNLPAQWIIRAIILTLVFLILLTFGTLFSQIYDRWMLNKIRQDNMNTIQVFREITKAHPLLAGDVSLFKRVNLLKADLDKQKQYYEKLTRTTLRHGFSNYLQALISAVPDGVWLDEIEINQATQEMSLGGYTSKPAEVFLFLKTLRKTPPFENIKFNVFSVKAVPEQSITEFKITNIKAEKK